MVFKREWDSSCPIVWDKWEADGITWTVEDLAPEDDELVVQLYLEEFIPDETLCSTLGIHKDSESLQFMGKLWRDSVSQRVSLACYKTVANKKTLAGVNICFVKCIDDEEPNMKAVPAKFYELIKTLKYLDTKYDAFKDFGVDKYLYGHGLLVTRENRGFKLGARILAGRDPMCLKYGLKATSTMFTGIASQKSAVKCGYKTDLEVTLDEFARNDLAYPKGDQRSIKIMSKIYS